MEWTIELLCTADGTIFQSILASGPLLDLRRVSLIESRLLAMYRMHPLAMELIS